jgi:NADPH:quinone reductase-like Zn-dependent oxidoreductase
VPHAHRYARLGGVLRLIATVRYSIRERGIEPSNSINAVANAAPRGAAAAMTALADGGRLATITPDPPASTRGISVTAVYVRSDGAQLDRLTALLDSHRLSMPTPRSCGLDQAASALAQVAGHEASGVVITKGKTSTNNT